MTDAEKLTTLKTMLKIDGEDEDAQLNVYLSIAHDEILNWMYINEADVPEGAEMPAKYDMTQINAVIAGFNLQGGENQFRHSENGITREWHYSDLLDYIRAHVYQLLVVT